MADEVVRCGHCGLQVPVTAVGNQRTFRIDWLTYDATCRRAKDLAAYSAVCPELQRAIAGHSGSDREIRGTQP